MKSILDPSFRYTPSFNTDLRRTFARIRRDERRQCESDAAARPAMVVNVASIVGKTARGR